MLKRFYAKRLALKLDGDIYSSQLKEEDYVA